MISHPDAGKSTLTEALALHARVITEAGAVHGKGDRRATVSDWMAMEKARGISITSAALQFVYRDHVINLVDTPGHSDFSEDTYRVLSAVDSAVMLVDAGKGLEPQTLKLFKVCALRGIPVMTVINKWDRRQHPVGVLGEVAVAGGVDEVDHVVAVDELQRRRRDRDAARLLHRHPVRHGRAPVALAVDGARLGDHPGVEGEGLGQRRLAGVGVADDGERTAGAGVGHRVNLPGLARQCGVDGAW